MPKSTLRKKKVKLAIRKQIEIDLKTTLDLSKVINSSLRLTPLNHKISGLMPRSHSERALAVSLKALDEMPVIENITNRLHMGQALKKNIRPKSITYEER